ncbi:TPA: hypothetical protein ACSTJ2_001326 [Serratia fonticola]
MTLDKTASTFLSNNFHFLSFNAACAQCYPRLACPLHVSLFMQLHACLEAAPALGRDKLTTRIIRMQNHALCACTRKNGMPARKKAAKGQNQKQ